MKIRHERPLSDLSFQVCAPLGLELARGERIDIKNWSLRGFEFPGDSDIMPKEAILSIPFQGVDIRFPVRLVAEKGSRFLCFDGLSGRQRETLAVFYHSILSGRMASTNDVITSLDTPVDLVPMEETEEEKAAATANTVPRPARILAMSLIYFVVAVIVFSTLGKGIYARVATISVENARIEAPLTPLLAAQGGYVDEILVEPGDDVRAGQVLVRVETPEGEANLAEVRSRISLLEDRIERLRQRAEGYANTLAAVRLSLVDALNTSRPQDRAANLMALNAFDGRYAADHQALFDVLTNVEKEIEDTDDELRRLRRERGRLRSAADALHVMAPHDGTVTDIHVLDGQFVARGGAVLLMENVSSRVARGWVDQSMSAALYTGMAITVTANTQLGLQHLSGEIVELEAGIDPDLSPDFGMLISVVFTDLTPEQSRTELPHLMPVHIEASRPWAQRVRHYQVRVRLWVEDWYDVPA
ncbi:HlyD family efflux transporter periplasmic adaptor subunit [Ahrensia marina]|uniref:HlyD family secretion protein n=1 Tax=Ahrensia marina TaxID=1514904 RepID=UPI0035CFA148